MFSCSFFCLSTKEQIYKRIKILYAQFCGVIFEMIMLYSIYGKKISIFRQRSLKTSLSQYWDLFHLICIKVSRRLQQKMDHAELLPLGHRKRFGYSVALKCTFSMMSEATNYTEILCLYKIMSQATNCTKIFFSVQNYVRGNKLYKDIFLCTKLCQRSQTVQRFFSLYKILIESW